jgi:branched-chain amino acid aminotransferase
MEKIGSMVWHNGSLIPWDEAKIHVMSHVIHYGSSLFEGIRCYQTKNGPAVFRLGEHIQRLLDSCHIYRMELPYDYDDLVGACRDLVRVNAFDDGCYLRPIAFRGYGTFGVNPFPAPVEVYICTWAWGRYLGEEALEEGVDVCVSSWTRMALNTFPAMAKSGANYMNSQLIKMEALVNGFAEGIALDSHGCVSEGSGENVFVVRNGAVWTPPLNASVLPGVTRHSVIQLCRDLEIPVSERQLPREYLYVADEVFLTGTAAELTPVRTIDKIQIGKGRRGPITERLQRAFFDITSGRVEDRHGWLTPVEVAAAAPVTSEHPLG